MRLHRFFIAQPLGEEIVITDKELLKQWFSVLRYKGAEECILFNGDGLDYTYIIQSIDKQKAHLALKEKEKSILPEKEVLLVVSLIKKDKLEWIIQKGTEIGVTGFVLTEADHSEKKGVNLERLESIAKEAAEQSWRGTIPTITLTKSLKEALIETEGTLRCVASLNKNDKKSPAGKTVSLFIGPEGGWSKQEEELFDEKGFHFISLGRTVLRAETAAIVGAFQVMHVDSF